MERLTGHFELDVRTLDALLGVERCFDMIARDLVAGGRRCRLYVVDGYGDDAVLERMIGFWLALPSTADAADAQTFIDRYVTFSEVNAEADLRQTATAVFLGKTLLLAEGYDLHQTDFTVFCCNHACTECQILFFRTLFCKTLHNRNPAVFLCINV